MLNRPSSIDNILIEALLQRTCLEHLYTPPNLEEVNDSIKHLNAKSLGIDGIPPEVFKHGGTLLVQKLLELFSVIWEQGSVPQQFKDASIVHLYKNKGK